MELRKYVNYFEDEVDFDSFSDFGDMVSKLLILFKLRCDVSLKVEDAKLRVVNNPSSDPGVNCLIIEGSELFVSEDSLAADVTAFLNTPSHAEAFKSSVKAYIDKEKKVTQLVSENKDLEISYVNNRLLGLILSKLVPWHFNSIKKDDPDQDKPGLNREVMAMISTLIKSNDEQLNIMLREEITKHGIDNVMFMKNMEMLGAKLIEKRVRNHKDNLQAWQSSINDYIRMIADTNEKIKDAQYQIRAIEMGEADVKAPITEMMNLIKYSPENITIDDLDGSWLKLSFAVPMENFEEDEYRAYVLNSTGSYFYCDEAEDYDVEDLRALYKAIFDTRKVKVYFNSGMKVNLETGALEKHNSSYPAANTMKHPHLDMGYFCTGNTASYVAQYIRESAYAEAVSIVIQSAKQFSISDTAIGCRFIEGLFEHACIEMPNGEFMSGSEALMYIKDHKEEFDD